VEVAAGVGVLVMVGVRVGVAVVVGCGTGVFVLTTGIPVGRLVTSGFEFFCPQAANKMIMAILRNIDLRIRSSED